MCVCKVDAPSTIWYIGVVVQVIGSVDYAVFECEDCKVMLSHVVCVDA